MSNPISVLLAFGTVYFVGRGIFEFSCGNIGTGAGFIFGGYIGGFLSYLLIDKEQREEDNLLNDRHIEPLSAEEQLDEQRVANLVALGFMEIAPSSHAGLPGPSAPPQDHLEKTPSSDKVAEINSQPIPVGREGLIN